jgi:hypothetical protein
MADAATAPPAEEVKKPRRESRRASSMAADVYNIEDLGKYSTDEAGVRACA